MPIKELDYQLDFAHAIEGATQITQEHGLPCRYVLVLAMAGMYRDPPHRYGTEFEDGFALETETLEQFRKCFLRAKDAIDEMDTLIPGRMRRGVPFVVNTRDQEEVMDVIQALLTLKLSKIRPQPLDGPLAFLPRHIDQLGNYLLFVFDAPPVIFDDEGEPTALRHFIGNVLTHCGWEYSKAQIDEECRAMEGRFRDLRGSSTGIRLRRADREEVKDWRAKRLLSTAA